MVSESLDGLLARAKAAAPGDRIELRDAIAAHGAAAVHALRPWLDTSELWRFAVRVISKASEFGAREAAITALRDHARNAPLEQRIDVEAELDRLGAPRVIRWGSYDLIDENAIRDRLVMAAKRGEVVHYADLAKATGREMKGPNWAVHIGRILGRISANESQAGRPLLSVIVVSRDTKLPGSGFYNLGQELHAVEFGEDELTFVERETRRVYDYWQGDSSSGALRSKS